MPPRRPGGPHDRQPGDDQQAVLEEHHHVEHDHGAPVVLVLQVHVGDGVHGGDQHADAQPAARLAVEGAARRQQPQEHADPVEAEHEEDPRAVRGQVGGQGDDARGDRAQPPEELRDDTQPGQHELVDVLDVLAEGGERPADREEGEGRGHRYQVGGRTCSILWALISNCSHFFSWYRYTYLLKRKTKIVVY